MKRKILFKTLKRCLSIFLLCAALAFGGCGDVQAMETEIAEPQLINDIQITVEPIDNQLTDIKETEMKTIEPPEDGWTLDDINQVLYMNGQQIKLPILFSTLKDGYEIKDKKYKDKGSDDPDVVGGTLYYKDEFIAVISFYELENDIQILTMIFSPSYYSCYNKSLDIYKDYSNYVNINGFNLESDINEIENYLGTDYYTESNMIVYQIKKSNYKLLISNNNEDFYIIFSYRKDK